MLFLKLKFMLVRPLVSWATSLPIDQEVTIKFQAFSWDLSIVDNYFHGMYGLDISVSASSVHILPNAVAGDLYRKSGKALQLYQSYYTWQGVTSFATGH